MIASAERPVPLHYEWVTTPVHETIEERLATHQAPIYVVHFSRAAAIEQAQALNSLRVCTREEKDQIADLIGGFRFAAGFGKVLSRLVRNGIGVHHAGMLPKYRRLVELLAQAGLLKIICGTDTLGVGINVPIRTVLFTSLSKYDGVKPAPAHRAGVPPDRRSGRPGRVRRGRHRAGAGARSRGGEPQGPGQGRRRPEEAPQGRPQEAAGGHRRLRRTDVRPVDQCPARAAGVQLRGHPRHDHQRHLPAGELLDGDESSCSPTTTNLRDASASTCTMRCGSIAGCSDTGVVERLDQPDDHGRLARLTVDLQADFALNQPLSPFALAAVDLLDVESPEYPLDALSVIESILENPRPVLSAQRKMARGEAVEAMKREGLEYEERMELLEEITYAKPLQDLLEVGYQAYAKSHPWVLDHALEPKSVARDLFERSMTFTEYVAFYGLARAEGLVLRYLADAYKALRQTVPETKRTEGLEDLIAWLGELVRQTDSSLLDEWEKLRNPDPEAELVAEADRRPPAVTTNVRAFTVLVRNALFRRVELIARRRW